MHPVASQLLGFSFCALAMAACSGASSDDAAHPQNPACDDLYQPMACIDGNEVCHTNADGCRQCTCEPNREPAPGQDLPSSDPSVFP